MTTIKAPINTTWLKKGLKGAFTGVSNLLQNENWVIFRRDMFKNMINDNVRGCDHRGWGRETSIGKGRLLRVFNTVFHSESPSQYLNRCKEDGSVEQFPEL